MAAKKRTRAKPKKTMSRTMNQAASRVLRRTKGLQREAAGAMHTVEDLASRGTHAVQDVVAKQPFWAGAASAAAVAALGMFLIRR